MSVIACDGFVADGCNGPHCWNCGHLRAKHEGRAKPTTGARLPTPVELLASLTEAWGAAPSRVAIVRADRAAILARLDEIHAGSRRGESARWHADMLDALRAELRGGS